MKNIDRFWKVMEYRDFDHPPFFMENVWHETEVRWNSEGLPKGVSWHHFLGIKPLDYYWHGFNHGLHPEFEREVLEDNDEFIIFKDAVGRTVKDFKSHVSMPMWLDFAVKDRDSFEKVLQERIQIVFEERLSADYEQRIALINSPDFDGFLVPPAGNLFFNLDALMGVETVSMMWFEAPDLLETYFHNISEMCAWFMKKLFKDTAVSGVVKTFSTGEDLAFKNGPFFSPDIFAQYFMPAYKKIRDICRENNANFGFIDTDGNFDLLIPQMLECGLNIYCPCEVAAGMDPVTVRARYGKDVRFLGGVDKRIIAAGKDAISKEMDRLFPVMAEGGFVPIIDHSVPSTVSWDNFRYYIDKLGELHERCAHRA